MLSAHAVDQRLALLRSLPRPVLSVYVRIEPDRASTQTPPTHAGVRAGVHAGLHAALAAIPHPLAPRLVRGVLEALDQALDQTLGQTGQPREGGTMAVFAAATTSDAPPPHSWWLPSSPPLRDDGDDHGESDLVVRVGEPWSVPLRLALAQTERLALVHLHARGVSVHELFLGEIERVVELSPPSMPAPLERRRRSPTRPNAPERRPVAWRRRFYADASADLVPIFQARAIPTMVLLGEPPDRRLFTQVAPPTLCATLLGEGPGLPQRDASPAQILAAVREQLDALLRARQRERLAQVRAHGVLGLDDCLTQLQRGQLERLFVPWDLDRDLFVELDTGQVATSPGRARAASKDHHGRVTRVRAQTTLIELADRYSTRLELFRPAATGSPLDPGFSEATGIAGVAGLPRWLA